MGCSDDSFPWFFNDTKEMNEWLWWVSETIDITLDQLCCPSKDCKWKTLNNHSLNKCLLKPFKCIKKRKIILYFFFPFFFLPSNERKFKRYVVKEFLKLFPAIISNFSQRSEAMYWMKINKMIETRFLIPLVGHKKSIFFFFFNVLCMESKTKENLLNRLSLFNTRLWRYKIDVTKMKFLSICESKKKKKQ